MIPRQTDRIYLSTNEIDASDRVRTDHGDLDSLVDSIRQYGLLQPIVVNQHKKLIAGGRRLRAWQAIGEPEIPVVFYETLSDLQVRQLEVEENIVRKDFDWKERAMAIASAHQLATRDAILHKGAKQWLQQQTGDLLKLSVASVNNALVMARYIRMGDKEILDCPNMGQAFQVLLLRKEREAQKRLADFITAKAVSHAPVTQAEVDKLVADGKVEFFSTAVGSSGGGVTAPSIGDDEMPGQAAVTAAAPSPHISLSQLVINADSLEWMRLHKGASFDHIITDIPYGIDMDNLTGVEEVKAEHDAKENEAQFAEFLHMSYHVLKENGYCIFWLDLDHWEKLRDLATQTGFKVQRWPLHWHKTSSCKNSSPQFNWTKNVEHAMVCRKGLATLNTPQTSNLISGPNDSDIDHPFAKPAYLWNWILRAVATPGQTILDPYAGRGSFAVAAVPFGVVPVSVEKNADHYNKLVENVQNAYKKIDASIKFV